MSAALDFDRLVQLAGNKSLADVPCPLCGPGRSSRATQRKPVLRIWHSAPDFATFTCARCGTKGWAASRHATLADRRELVRRMRAAEEHQAASEAKRRSKARWLWSQSMPISGMVAETYLRKCRGIGAVPPTLRYLPARGEHSPAMLAAFGLPTEPEPGRYELALAAVHAIHITRLKSDGSGKAPDALGRSKIILGVTEGWPIALVPPNDGGGIVIAEGIEDALSLHCATGLGAWAAGAANRMPKLAPVIASLPYVERVAIAMDDDAAGRRHAQRFAHELRRLRGNSIEINVVEFSEASYEAA
jgi:hypothetical protein